MTRERLIVCLSLLTPLLLTLSFPRFEFSFLAWIALVPFLLAIMRTGRIKAFVLSWGIGLLSYMGIFFWIHQVRGYTLYHYLISGIYLGAYWGILGLLLNLVDHRRYAYPLYVAIAWVTLEYIRSNFFFLSFPWALLGQTQYKNINLIQISGYTGVYGLSFLLVMVNASIAALLYHFIFISHCRQGKGEDAFLTVYLSPILLVLLLSLWGKSVRRSYDTAGMVRVGLVQGNIAQEIKWNKDVFPLTFERYKALTKKVALEKPSLVIWPETAIPVDFRSQPRAFWRILGLAREVDIPIIFGAAGSSKIGGSDGGEKGIYNSAFYISSQGKILGEYHKIRLLPFGEYIPSMGGISFAFLTPGLKGNFVPGDNKKLFSLANDRFGVTICWENIFPDLFRGFVSRGASFMINISNDAWFKDSAGPYQHLMCQVFRAVENRISIVRVANTGISCVIDPFGSIVKRVGDDEDQYLNITGVASEDIQTNHSPTFYTRYGDIFVIGCTAMLVIYLVWRSAGYLWALTSRKEKDCSA